MKEIYFDAAATTKPRKEVLDVFNELLMDNNFISACNPKIDFEFNNECYKNCPDYTKLDNSIINKKFIFRIVFYLNH